jgi:uncharacterized protein
MPNYSDEEKNILLEIADQAIKYGLEYAKQIPIHVADYPDQLRAHAASFVTLQIGEHLRGCIGSLLAHRPLISDVAANAYAAAFCDPRFPPLNHAEYMKISRHISVLSEPEPMSFVSEDDLLSQLRPGIDGLILSEHGYRSTFLPAVWESLPDARDFLRHLKLKAGLPKDYWSDTIRVERYTSEMIE